MTAEFKDRLSRELNQFFIILENSIFFYNTDIKNRDE